MSTTSKAKFEAAGQFHQTLKARADRYFTETGKSPRDVPGMYLKTAVILSWFAASYVFLVFFASSVALAAVGSISLALATAGIGFAVMHDANHGGYSAHRNVNRVLSNTLDLVGGSSYIWSWKHNVFHHTHPNVAGLDEDLDVGIFGRLAPDQKHRRIYRFQHLYLWPLYGMLSVKWHFVDDWLNLIHGRVGAHAMPRPRGWKLVQFIAGKSVFYGWSVVLPLFFHPLWVVALAHVVTSFLLGVVLAVTFQLAHCVEEAEFPALPPAQDPNFKGDWATHQLRTTVDFAPGNPVLTWYMGGLNYQVVHHLFPAICHLHYPALSKIVDETAREYGLTYRVQRTFRGALASHGRWLRRMGDAPVTGTSLAPSASRIAAA